MNAAPNLVSLAPSLHEYFAPAFRVTVDKADLRARLGLDVQSVTVDQPLETSARFSFVVGNLFDVASRNFGDAMAALRLGAEVVVEMGYRDTTALRPMIVGLVTEVTTSFPNQGLPQVTVSGFDLAYPMTKCKRSRNWEKATDSEVVALIAAKYGLAVDAVDTRVRHAKVEQNQEQDSEFVRKLAERNGYEVYARGRTLRFGPPRLPDGEVLTMEWGKGLLSFTPEVNLADQVEEVEVHGWDAEGKTEIVGRARAGSEPGKSQGEVSGPELVRVLASDAKISVRRPVLSQQEADTLARSILDRRAERFVSGSGESLGVPQLGIDQNVFVDGLGTIYSRAYYIEQVTHTISSAGYRTTFKVKDTALKSAGARR